MMTAFKTSLLGAASVAATITMLANPAWAAAAEQSASPEARSSAGDDIVVTARRREESIQSVPVSVQAFSGETLDKLNIRATNDLQRLVPGVVFNGSGSDINTTFTIRGQGRATIGTISPSVQSYVNEVALPTWGAMIPTYDVSNVQVLKGPQGTLFGRNTTGGAVLVYSQAPKYDFGGYASATLGDFDWHELEGALNLPIVEDKVALRVAGQYRKRDGHVRAGIDGQPDGQNVNSRAFRVSLLVEPIEGVKNTTIYDYLWSHTSEVVVPTEYSAGFSFNVVQALFGPGLAGLAQGVLDQAKATGYRTYYNLLSPSTRVRIQGVTNTTEFDIGKVQVKNIFGYRTTRFKNVSDTDGAVAVLTDCFNCTHADDQISNELQISTSAFNDTMSILLGGYYLRNKPEGKNALGLAFFAPPGTPPTPSAVAPFGVMMDQQDKPTTKAIFLSISQKLDGIVPGLKLNLSGRHTWDSSSTCADGRLGTSTPYSSYEDCVASPTSSTPTSKFKKFTWSAGLDYQATPDLFFYGVARTGYRAGGANTPVLGTLLQPFQTFAPQTVTDFEIGIKADYDIAGARARTNISAYTSKFKNLQLSASGIPGNSDGDGNPLNDPTFTTLNLNAGDATTRGVEIDGFIIPVENLRLSYAGSYFYGKIRYDLPAGVGAFVNISNTRLNYAPSTSINLAADYTVPNVLGGDLNFNVNWYRISRFRIDFATNAGYNLLNASVELANIAGSGLSVQVFGQNLTDKLYFTNPNASGGFPGYQTWSPGPPRMYGVRGTYRFGSR